MAYLALVRHGESEYNVKGLWTGWENPPLTLRGHEEARIAGEDLKEINWDVAYVSDLIRAQETLDEIKATIHRLDLPVIISSAIKERNYGDYTGRNKWEIQKEIGNKKFQLIRRSWGIAPKNGESLKQVYEREVPYLESVILPKIKSGENIMLISSGNALRALVKYLENIPDAEIYKIEIATGETYLYQLNSGGKLIDKKILGKKIQHQYRQ